MPHHARIIGSTFPFYKPLRPNNAAPSADDKAADNDLEKNGSPVSNLPEDNTDATPAVSLYYSAIESTILTMELNIYLHSSMHTTSDSSPNLNFRFR